MMTTQCDRLLINDTNLDRGAIMDCIGADMDTYNIQITDSTILSEQIQERLYSLLRRSDRIILPGRSSSIFLKCVDVPMEPDQTVFLPSIRRKLEGLTPRGIDVNETDMMKLSSIRKNETILLLDDVVASGTTVNGIAKRLGRTNMNVLSLVSRDPTDLKPAILENLMSGCKVQSLKNKIPAINTLSSLQDPEKVDILIEGFRRLYGDQFVERILQLFPNP